MNPVIKWIGKEDNTEGNFKFIKTDCEELTYRLIPGIVSPPFYKF